MLIFFLETNVMNGLPGCPLTQVLVYASLFNKPDDIDISIFELLIQGADLDVRVRFHGRFSSPIELAIRLKRLDLVKLMVKSGADPIDPFYKHISDEFKLHGIAQIFDEFYEFGTNEFISWLLNKHLTGEKLDNFICKVIKVEKLFGQVEKEMFEKVRRSPTHSILTCQHEKMIRKFLPESHQKSKLTLATKDERGLTALQKAVENGDLKSVKILLKM